MVDFNRTPEAQDTFREKRKPKGPIKFKLSLNEEQKETKELILNTPITLVKGMAGSGKTLLACQIALDLVFRKELDKLIITRPTVAKEDIGFLPGDLKEKMDPWLAPIYANLHLLYDKTKIEKMIADGVIEIVPFAFMRGRTFPNSFIIVDECQNMTQDQTEMIMGRLGKGGKMVFCGDGAQIDLRNKKDSGISFFKILEARTNNVKTKTLKKNHRHEALEEILNIFEEYRN
jgi:phosphate starvation-inducible protein PhoH and related proteins